MIILGRVEIGEGIQLLISKELCLDFEGSFEYTAKVC